jgi:hypothetical protein
MVLSIRGGVARTRLGLWFAALLALLGETSAGTFHSANIRWVRRQGNEVGVPARLAHKGVAPVCVAPMQGRDEVSRSESLKQRIALRGCGCPLLRGLGLAFLRMF